MIQELSAFAKALSDRYGQGVYIKELTITDAAAQQIPHVGPKPGDFLDVYCDANRVRIWNGGDGQTIIRNETYALATEGGYPYKLIDEVPGFIRGEILLPTGEWIDCSWDADGNVFTLGGWPENLRALCRIHVRAVQAELIAAAEVPVIQEVTAQLGHQVIQLPVHVEQHAALEQLSAEAGVAVLEPEPAAPEQQRAITVAGYEVVILERKHMGFVTGVVQLPNGELTGATWDSDGDDLEGRPKFKLVKGF